MSLLTESPVASNPTGQRDAFVTTRLGDLRGIERDGVRIFRGVRYAKPPVGALRFMPPQELDPWNGVADASAFGPVPFQPYDPSVDHDTRDMSEDCLSLNVWTPKEPGSYPVLVWIHGGGQTIGSTRRNEYEGSHFASKGVVCVTVGYRLGAFGFLELGELLGPTYEGSGNNAIRDLLLALRWVNEHISAFGGDPSRVTLGGESAGAKNAVTLAGIPSARGLFHRLVSCSGGAHTILQPADARDVARLLCDAAGLSSDQAQRLLELPATDLLSAQEFAVGRWDRRFAFRPVVDGSFFPAPVLAQIAAGTCSMPPTMLGFTRDECRDLVDEPTSDRAPNSRMLSHVPADRFMEVERRYADMLPGLSAMERRVRTLTAQEYAIPTILLAQALSASSAPVWVYRFDGLPGAYGDLVPPTHVADLPLWWGHPLLDTPLAGSVALAMHEALVAFVQGKELDRRGAAIAWPRYEASKRHVLSWGRSINVELDPEPVERSLWSDVL